ncbi:glutathione S-transferase domain protein (plasmid) [Methylobacterium aquaticum]|uniref:Glutathione S-transferase domain protein n=1 Tax=Methylobacterium aquaticum TaxID=270351 RepID=A0A0C6FNE1_9HYPH|nr:glutathione S-transferase domain protein [Methylobacterium aquaticum]
MRWLDFADEDPYRRRNTVDLIDRRSTLVAADRPNRDVMVDNPLGEIPARTLEGGTILVDSGAPPRAIGRQKAGPASAASRFPAPSAFADRR